MVSQLSDSYNLYLGCKPLPQLNVGVWERLAAAIYAIRLAATTIIE